MLGATLILAGLLPLFAEDPPRSTVAPDSGSGAFQGWFDVACQGQLQIPLEVERAAALPLRLRRRILE